MATIVSLANDLCITSNNRPSLFEDQQDILADFMSVLAVVQSVARQQKADQKTTISRASCLLGEVHEILLIMAKVLLLMPSSVPCSKPSVTLLGKNEEGVEVSASIPTLSLANAEG